MSGHNEQVKLLSPGLASVDRGMAIKRMKSMKQKFKIEDDIPLPPKNVNASAALVRIYETMEQMKCGQSFYVSDDRNDPDYERVKRSLHQFPKRFREYNHFQFALRRTLDRYGVPITPPEFRCWRIDGAPPINGLTRASRAKKKSTAEKSVKKETVAPTHKVRKSKSSKQVKNSKTIKVPNSGVDPTTRPNSLAGKIYAVLVAEDEPMNITEILVGLGKSEDDEVYYRVVEVLLNGFIEEQNTFAVDNECYGLKEWT